MADKEIADLTDGGAVQSGDRAHVVRGLNSRGVTLDVGAGMGLADQEEAEAGTAENVLMNPLRTKQAITENVGSVVGEIAVAASRRASGAHRLAGLLGTVYGYGNGLADGYADQSGVDAATSTNESYDAGNDLYAPSVTAGSMISAGTGSTLTGDFSTRTSTLFDGNVTQSSTVGATTGSGVTSGYAGKNYSSSAQSIGSAIVYGSNNEGFIAGGNPNITISLYGKTGGAPSNSTNGTLLGTTTFADTANESAGRTVTSSNAGPWDYVWVKIDTDGSADFIRVAELQFFQPGTTNNMTLISETFTAEEAPDTARIATFIDPQEAITVNTDYTVEVSRDGTTWAMATLVEVPSPVGDLQQWEDVAVDLSGQSSGTTMHYRKKTLNGKLIHDHGVDFNWS